MPCVCLFIILNSPNLLLVCLYSIPSHCCQLEVCSKALVCLLLYRPHTAQIIYLYSLQFHFCGLHVLAVELLAESKQASSCSSLQSVSKAQWKRLQM